jgi:hypothetical protein
LSERTSTATTSAAKLQAGRDAFTADIESEKRRLQQEVANAEAVKSGTAQMTSKCTLREQMLQDEQLKGGREAHS